MKANWKLSIVIPVYQEAGSLPLICKEFESAITDIPYEILFINDGNLRNEVFDILTEMGEKPNVRVIHLSRNFGQHVAIAAGLKNSTGDYVLIMDADLQYSPKECFEMARWGVENGKEAVVSIIRKRSDRFLRRKAAAVFYWIMSRLGIPQRGDLGSAFVMSRHVADGICKMSDRFRMTIPMIHWLGGDVGHFQVSHQKRYDKKSGYRILQLIQFAIKGVIHFSTKPLYIVVGFSALYSVVGIGIGAHFLFSRLVLGIDYPEGWASTIIVIFFSFALLFAGLGILGLYIARIFEFTVGRPLYFVREGQKDVKLFEDLPETRSAKTQGNMQSRGGNGAEKTNSPPC